MNTVTFAIFYAVSSSEPVTPNAGLSPRGESPHKRLFCIIEISSFLMKISRNKIQLCLCYSILTKRDGDEE